MIEKLLKQLATEGKLRPQAVGGVQIEALLRQAVLDLQEAEKIRDLAERATYVLAYMAMLKAGRALLLRWGYSPDDGAQHRTVVEVTAAILGEKYRTLTLQFERMRRKRNEMTYEAGILLSRSESKQAFTHAKNLVQGIFEEAKKKDPQLHLNL